MTKLSSLNLDNTINLNTISYKIINNIDIRSVSSEC